MYWCVYCVVSSFASVYLLENGFSNTEIGILLAIGNVFSVMIQPVAANIADRSKRITVLDILMIMTVLIGFFEIFTWVIRGKSIVLFVTYIFMVAFHASMQPLLNSINVPFARLGVNADYGISRGMGSLGYSIMSAMTGAVVGAMGARILPIAGELGLALMLLGLLVLKYMYNHPQKYQSKTLAVEKIEEKQDITMKEFARRHKLFLCITLGIFLMFYHHQIINYFMLQVFQNVGGDSYDMGIYYSLMSFLEIPALMGFSWLNKKFSTSFLLKLGVVGLVLRGLLMYLAASPLAVQMSLIVNPFGFPLFLGAIVKYINEIMDAGEAVRGQSMYIMVITVSAVIASFTGGIILDGLGAKTMLLICLVLCIAGAVIVLPLIDRAAKESERKN